MSIALDLIVIAVIVLFILLGRKKGFVRTAIELAGWIAVSIFAIPLAQSISGWIYDTFISVSICNGVNSAISAGVGDMSSAINDFIKGLPEFISSNLADNKITSSIILEQSDAQENIALAVSNVIKPVICPLISALIGIIIAFVGIFLVNFLARICSGIIVKLPIVGGMNSVLGIVVGGLKGVVIAIIIVSIVSAVIGSSNSGIFGITKEAIDNTYIFKALVDFLN